MYFEVKAFKGTTRRFENLDSIDELNVFVDEYTTKGFLKFIIKSYDENGFRKRRFLKIENGFNKFLN
jgi:hypothetical protein|tara:strand:- start:948 stop:1148 length:201 start_codon:yes stop_codon:yes gene_type:complete